MLFYLPSQKSLMLACIWIFMNQFGSHVGMHSVVYKTNFVYTWFDDKYY